MFLKRSKKLLKASQQAKSIANQLKLKAPSSVQWDYDFMGQNLKEAYFQLRSAWKTGIELYELGDYLTPECISFLTADSGTADISCFDILECFDFELDDLAIICVVSSVCSKEDKFVAWLDHASYGPENDLGLDMMEELDIGNVQNVGIFDSFSRLSGISPQIFDFKVFDIAPNDCWTFKWSQEKNKWLLDLIMVDRQADLYLKTFSNPLSIE
ncbi:MAG TPA: hypothetical protein V6C96_02465 [Vampirovibrionales bacterium]